MGLFDQFPYTNFHELNLMWILEALKKIQTTTEQFVAINSLKYANPIQWNITTQYEKNTIVIDSQSGTAYISVQAVPTGVALTNEDYWTVVFDLGVFVTRAAKNFTTRFEEDTTLTATFNSVAGDWLVWGDTLYIANVNITAGDSYVVDGNIRRITVEEVKNEIYSTFNNMIGDLEDLSTTDKSNLVAAINEVADQLAVKIGDLEDLTTTDKSNLVAAINEVADQLAVKIGDLEDLTTTDKSNLVAAINEVNTLANEVNTLANDALNTANNVIDLWEIIDLQPFAQDINTAITEPYPQGGCVFKHNNSLYVLSILYNENTEECVWSVYSVDNNTLVYRSTSIPSKHSNSVTYYDGYFYCSRGGDLFVYKVPFDLTTYTTINMGSDTNYSIYYDDGYFYLAERNHVIEVIDPNTLQVIKTINHESIVSPNGLATPAFLAVDNNKLYLSWLDYETDVHEMYCQVMNMSGHTVSVFKYPTYNEPESMTFLDGVMYVSLGIQNSCLWCKSTQYRNGVYAAMNDYYAMPTYPSLKEVYCNSTTTSFLCNGSNDKPFQRLYYAYIPFRHRYTHYTIYVTGDFSNQANFNIKKCNCLIKLEGTDQLNGVNIAGIYALDCTNMDLQYINVINGNGNDNYSVTARNSNIHIANCKIIGNNQVGAIFGENANIVLGGVNISGDFTSYLFNLSSITNFSFTSGNVSLNTNKPSASRGHLRLFNNYPATYLKNWDRSSKLDIPISIDNQTITITDINLSGVYALESNNTVTGLPTEANLPAILEVRHLNNVFEYTLKPESNSTTIYYRKRLNANNDSGWHTINIT